MEPGAVASEVARAAGIHASQLFRWRRQLCERTQVQAAFNPVAITPEPEAASAPAVAERAGVIEIEFATGGRMRITGKQHADCRAKVEEGADRVRLIDRIRWANWQLSYGTRRLQVGRV